VFSYILALHNNTAKEVQNRVIAYKMGRKKGLRDLERAKI
jgi:hypothetical protein